MPFTVSFKKHPRLSVAWKIVFSFLIAGFGAGTLRAQTVSVCVNSSQDLQKYLDSASDGGTLAGQSVDIQLVKGTYLVGSATGNGPFHYSSTSETAVIGLKGGFNSDCSVQEPTPVGTILDGNHSAQVLNINNSRGQTSIFLLTVRNGQSTKPGGGMSINEDILGGGPVDVNDSIIENNSTSSFGGGFVIAVSQSGGTELVSSLIIGNSADLGYGAGTVENNATSSDDGAFSVLSNTIYGNTTSKAGESGGLLCCGSIKNAQVYSNIFWQNTGAGLYLDSPTLAEVDYNDYGTIGGAAPASSFGNFSMDPKFVDAASGNFHLSGASTLFGKTAAMGYAGGVDLDGHPRNFYSVADPGAYEETVFGSDFEAN